MGHIFEDLREMVMRELEEIVKRGEMDETSLTCAYKLVDIVKDIDKIEMGEGGYSQVGRMYYPYAYDGGNSYENSYRGYSRQRRDSMGRYSRDDYSNRGYSRESEREEIMAKMGRMMDNAPSETERQAIQRIMNQL